MIKADGSYNYYLKDHLGSTRFVFDDDNNMVDYSDYYPFDLYMPDRKRVNSGVKEQFTGKERDAETGFDYFGARYYDPSIGRFITPDPLGGLTPFITPYHYCQNNPLNRIDPTGMNDDPIDLTGNTDDWLDEVTVESTPLAPHPVRNNPDRNPKLEDEPIVEINPQSPVLYQMGTTTFTSGHTHNLMMEGKGFAGRVLVDGNIYIYIGTDGNIYAKVIVSGYTAITRDGTVSYYGSVDVLSGEIVLSSHPLVQINSGSSIMAVNGWQNVGQSIFNLPSHSTSFIYLKVNVGYIYSEAGSISAPIPPTKSDVIRIGIILDARTVTRSVKFPRKRKMKFPS